MQLLIYITNHEDTIRPIMEKIAANGIKGATVVDCEGMLKSLNEDSVDAPAIFGGLRQFVNPGQAKNKMMFILLKDEQIQRMNRSRRLWMRFTGLPVLCRSRIRASCLRFLSRDGK